MSSLVLVRVLASISLREAASLLWEEYFLPVRKTFQAGKLLLVEVDKGEEQDCIDELRPDDRFEATSYDPGAEKFVLV
jgi:hypothetical protein